MVKNDFFFIQPCTYIHKINDQCSLVAGPLGSRETHASVPSTPSRRPDAVFLRPRCVRTTPRFPWPFDRPGSDCHHGTRLVQQRGRLFSDEPKGGNGRPSVLVGHQFEPRPVVLVVDKDGFGLAGKHSIDFDGQLHRATRTSTQCTRVVHILEPSKNAYRAFASLTMA